MIALPISSVVVVWLWRNHPEKMGVYQLLFPQVTPFLYLFFVSYWNWNWAPNNDGLVLAKENFLLNGMTKLKWIEMGGWMMEMYQMQMKWNVETNDWKKMDFSGKYSENNDKGRTIYQRVKIVWLHGRGKYVSQLSCNFKLLLPLPLPLLLASLSIWKKNCSWMSMMMYLWPLLYYNLCACIRKIVVN